VRSAGYTSGKGCRQACAHEVPPQKSPGVRAPRWRRRHC
jgi:hypothetical protein